MVTMSVDQSAVVERAAALAGMSVVAYAQKALQDRIAHDLGVPPDEGGTGQRTAAVVSALVESAARFTGPAEERWRWELPSAQELPARVRTLVRAELAGCWLDEQRDTCVVLLSELVTNAVRYGGAGSIVVQLVLAGSEVVCGVGDQSSAPPVPARPRLDEEGGRGLALLAAMANTYGWYHTATGKTVWFTHHLNGGTTSNGAEFPADAGTAHPALNIEATPSGRNQR